MRAMIFLEWSPPFRWKPAVNRSASLRRYIWGWWAIAFIPHDWNAYFRAVRSVVRDQLIDEMQNESD